MKHVTSDSKKIFVADLNRLIGKRVRDARLARGIKQKELADRVGVKSPQMHKYESGAQRISAGMLYAIAKEISVDVDSFYQHAETA